ncbi:MAG: penicillin-binding protein 2 [Bdellovibrionales bacterium]|jgi:cell division protein FtsI (penicillin-binding protein 3)|nr:penicillin-binding protein 2 [Bdellovibrionales bacterium]
MKRSTLNDGSISGHQAKLLGQAKARLAFVALVFVLGYLAVGLRLADLTLLRDVETAAEQSSAPVRKAGVALRGTITDRYGELMATSLRMASVYADATLVADAPALARQLSKILPEEKEKDILAKLSSKRKFVWIARNITPRQVQAINTLGEPSLGFQDEQRRIYPHGKLTSHILGYTDVDGIGIAGIERAHEKMLREGEDDLRLSIDLRIQHILHRELSASVKQFSAKAAIGIVMDVNNGDVIAMVSLPDFDPYHPAQASDEQKFNRATLGVFEMGSTMKLFPVAAALDGGRASFASTYDAREPIRFGRHTINDYHGKRRVMTLPEVFIHSSNIGTAKMAQELGEYGLRDFYKKLGFLERAPIDLPERGAPLYPRQWREIHTLTASYGHGIAVSPVHLARAAAALTNGGLMVTPTLVRQDGGADKDNERVVKPETSRRIRDLLELVVVGGTGSKAAAEGYGVGGKTGTADKTQGRGYSKNARLSSFIGVFPIEAPRYVVLAIVDEPQPTKETFGYATGGWTAAPVVGRVIEQMAPLYGIAPQTGPRRDIKTEMARYLKDSKEGKAVATAGTDR